MGSPDLNNLPFFENPNAEKLIVFVHGLTGHPEESWCFKKGDSTFFWPEHLAKQDPAFKKTDVYSFGYRSECGPTLEISEIAKSLEIRLNHLLETHSYDALSFVAHSMGGLVVREFIMSRHEHLQPKIPIESLVSLSTPNLGSGLAKLCNFFCKNIQMKVLTPGRGEYLDTLNDRWRERYEQNDGQKTFALSAAYELAPIPLLGLIVEKDAAVCFAQQTQGFIKDHREIAKATSAEDELYLWVKQRLLQKPPDPNTIQRSEAEEQRTTTVITELQKELKGTELDEALNLITTGALEQALALLSEHEEKEDQQVLKIAKARFAKAQVYELKRDYRKARDYYEKAVQLAPENTLYLNEAGLIFDTLGEYDQAIEYYTKALERDLVTFGPKHPDVAIDWNNLGAAWKAKGDYDRAIEYYTKALESDLLTFGPKHPNVARLWNNLGLAWDHKGEYDQAIEYYTKALESDLLTFGPKHPNVARLWNNLGLAWNAKGETDRAIEYYTKALESDLLTFGPKHPQVAIYWNNLGAAWNAKGDYDRAIEFYHKALESDLLTFGPKHPNVARLWNNLGLAWDAKGEYDRAIEYFTKALESDLATFGPKHPQVAIYWNNLGGAWRAKGEYDRAIEFFTKALESDLLTFGPKHPQVAIYWNNLGAAWKAKGEYDRAIEYFTKALESDLLTFGPKHPDVAIDWNNLGLAWDAKGEYDRAIEYYTKALEVFELRLGVDHPNTEIVRENIEVLKGK